MATKYVVPRNDIVSVADAIRSRTGKSENLVFPDGFVSEIQGLAKTSDLSALAEQIKSVKHIRGTLSFPDAFMAAVRLEDVPTTMIAFSSSTHSYRFAANSTTYLASRAIKSMISTLPSIINNCKVLGYLPHGSKPVYGTYWGITSTRTLFIGYVNLSMSSIKLNSNYYTVGYDYMFEQSYDPYYLGDDITWYRDAYNTEIWITGTGSMPEQQYTNNFFNAIPFFTLNIESGVTNIPAKMCNGNEYIRNVICENSVGEIGVSAFRSCSALSFVNIPAVTSIGSYAFHGCSVLSSINIPAVTSIEAYTFYGCSALSSINIPAVTSIGAYAFHGCSALSFVNIPAVTSIGNSAFYSCANPLNIHLLASSAFSPTTMGTNAFGLASKVNFYVSAATLYDDYIALSAWSTYSSRFVDMGGYTIAACAEFYSAADVYLQSPLRIYDDNQQLTEFGQELRNTNVSTITIMMVNKENNQQWLSSLGFESPTAEESLRVLISQSYLDSVDCNDYYDANAKLVISGLTISDKAYTQVGDETYEFDHTNNKCMIVIKMQEQTDST